MPHPAAPATKVLEQLAQIVGPAHLLTDEHDLAPYLTDWRGRYHGAALCVVRPGSTAEVAALVATCAAAHLTLVPQGGNTGLVGGAVPRAADQAQRPEIVLSTGRLNRIRHLDPLNHTLTAEAGCTLAEVQQAAADIGCLFPLSLASEGTATIGGNLSTNAGGLQVLRYGSMRDLTLGLEVVLADGQVWHGLRALRKDNTGYSLRHLFIGAEGTLGIITAAVLKLFPAVHRHATAWLAIPDPAAAVSLLGQLRQHFGERVSAFELINHTALELVLKHIPATQPPLATAYDWHILLQLDDGRLEADRPQGTDPLRDSLIEFLASAEQQGWLHEAVIAHSDAQAAALWKLRESISEAQKIDGLSIKHDISVPLSAIPEFIRRADQALHRQHDGLRIVCFGHVGDGNLHYNPSKAEAQDNAAFIATGSAVSRIVHDLVHELDGSISAEHGIGQLKRNELLHYHSPLESQLMHRLKQALDPQGIFNPGKLL